LKTTAALLLLTTSANAVLSNAAIAADADASSIEEIDVIAERLKAAGTGQKLSVIKPGRVVAERLDAVLGTVPGLGLFRRANSLSAHPTTQGLTLRGVGANAAGRVLVTLDGVPINDPFGGWVYWSALDPRSLAEVRVRKGGSPGAFGAQALAGAVDLISRVPEEDGGYASISYGNFDTKSLRAGFDVVGERGYFSVTGGYFESDGFLLRNESQRGSVDVAAASETAHITLRGSYELSDATTIFPTLRLYREERVNGLSLSLNETEALDASVRLLHQASDGPAFELTAYYRSRDLSNVFVSARDERTSERPVLDQFDVPASGAGLLARVQFDGFEFGFDAKRASGETNERFRNLGEGFTRQRLAGGDQWTVGAYAEAQRDHSWGAVSATVRVDRYRTYGGARTEVNIADGSSVRDDQVPNRGDWIWSGRLGFERDLTGAISMRAAAYKSWRLPTINEFYRPFRVVNDITEANPNLIAEKLYGVEIGFDYEPANTIKLSATFFRNWLNDGVGNITIGFGPGFFPLGGFVPGGGVLRQRANIDRSVTDGVELEGRVELQNGWLLDGQYLYSRARVTKFAARPELVGFRPVQTPRHAITAGLTYTGESGFALRTEARFSSDQFDDDLNTRRLDSIFLVNMRATYPLSENVTLKASAENLFDAVVVSGLSSTGLETLAQRRAVRVGVDISF